jgi:type IX secretion system PorP/SprF family membrane protein
MQSMVAQDFFFSQFYAAPLSLNPALTGFSVGDYRAVLNYRDVNKGLIPSRTYMGSFDMKLLKPVVKPDIFAAGLTVVSDQVAQGSFNKLSVLASTAYHKNFGSNKNHYIALGAQLGMFQRQADLNEYTYPNQWDPVTGYSPSNPRGEDFVTMETTIFDMNLGVFWYGIIGKTGIFAGGSSFHMLNPKESFLSDENRLIRRYVGHAGASIYLSEDFNLIPNVVLMYQNAAQQIAAGTMVEWKIPPTKSSFKIGGYYRPSDRSVIASTAVKVDDFELGLSTDFLSRMQTLSKTQSAFELSLTYSPAPKTVANLESDPSRR